MSKLIGKILIGLVAGLIILTAAIFYMYKLTPLMTEKILYVGLYSGISPFQKLAIRALRDYPTKHTAIALTIFINIKNIALAPADTETEISKDETEAEKIEREKKRNKDLKTRGEKRIKDLKVAEDALETLCLLSGESFGTYFTVEKYGHSWGSLSEDKWPSILLNLNSWAFMTFGQDILSALASGMSELTTGTETLQPLIPQDSQGNQ